MRIHGAGIELRGVPKHFGLPEAAQRKEEQREEELQAACFAMVAPSETSNFPGASTLSVFTTPLSTSIE